MLWEWVEFQDKFTAGHGRLGHDNEKMALYAATDFLKDRQQSVQI